MRKPNNGGRTEDDQAYAELMLKYMEEKYDTNFLMEEYIFPKGGFNTGMRENVLVVKDLNGVTANARARLGAPYAFYDNYLHACGADLIQRNMDLSDLQKLGDAKYYAVVNGKQLSDISIAPEGIASVTLVVNIPQQVTEEALMQLYEAYCQMCDAGYPDSDLTACFSDGSAEFTQAVENYPIYGNSNWTGFSGTVYAVLKASGSDLSYEDFRAALINK